MTYKIVIPEIPPSNNKYMGNGRMGSNYKYQEYKKNIAKAKKEKKKGYEYKSYMTNKLWREKRV